MKKLKMCQQLHTKQINNILTKQIIFITKITIAAKFSCTKWCVNDKTQEKIKILNAEVMEDCKM